MTKRKPSIKTKCPASTYAGPLERIAEFSFSDGTGGLIRLAETDKGNFVTLYRVDGSINIYVNDGRCAQ
jgi:hypothetical protein